MSTVLVTTCTAAKAEGDGLSARERYKGPRVAFAAAESQRRGLPLFFLSGRFGLVAATDPVPWYDQALQGEDVASLVPWLLEQLGAFGWDAVVFLARAADTPGWAPYHQAMGRACAEAGVPVRLELTDLD